MARAKSRIVNVKSQFDTDTAAIRRNVSSFLKA